MRTIFVLIACCATAALFAQPPQNFSFQAVVRDNAGDPVLNTSVGVEFKIRQGSALGTVVYSETHATGSNQLGMVLLEVGGGSPTVGSLMGIDWSAGPYFMEVGVDLSGGSNYISSGIQQLLSVPYALQAGKVDDMDDNDWEVSGDTVHVENKRVGIGTSAPDTTLHVVGRFKYQDGSEGAGRILMSDSTGAAMWGKGPIATYQWNDEPEVSYAISPPFVLEITMDQYPYWNSKAVPVEILQSYCGDLDGCRLTLTGVYDLNEFPYSRIDSRSFFFQYDIATGMSGTESDVFGTFWGNIYASGMNYLIGWMENSGCVLANRPFADTYPGMPDDTIHLLSDHPGTHRCRVRIDD